MTVRSDRGFLIGKMPYLQFSTVCNTIKTHLEWSNYNSNEKIDRVAIFTKQSSHQHTYNFAQINTHTVLHTHRDSLHPHPHMHAHASVGIAPTYVDLYPFQYQSLYHCSYRQMGTQAHCRCLSQ